MNEYACHLPPCLSAQALCWELGWVRKHLAFPRAPETGGHTVCWLWEPRTNPLGQEREDTDVVPYPQGCCVALVMPTSLG